MTSHTITQRIPMTFQSDVIDTPDLICLSHLRWDFVYQRPQHLMSRFATERRVFYVEEPILDTGSPCLELTLSEDNVWVVQPHLPELFDAAAAHTVQKQLLDELFETHEIDRYVLWYYTPAALPFTDHLDPLAIIYDCMDELSLFKGASPDLVQQEQALFDRADVVFTGGPSLYAAKREQHNHDNVHLFPSSIDVAHFCQARVLAEAEDQALLARPRLGFFGVIDERLDIDLLDAVAQARPDWQLVLVGPVVKIDPELLPQRPNIHYLGIRPYQMLPAYLAGWDVALMPFALNDATRFISPTKTPEYLAGGKPVVSTPIRDVIHLYGDLSLVRIVQGADTFVTAVEELLQQEINPSWLDQADRRLAQSSWDRTWSDMRQLLNAAIADRGI